MFLKISCLNFYITETKCEVQIFKISIFKFEFLEIENFDPTFRFNSLKNLQKRIEKKFLTCACAG